MKPTDRVPVGFIRLLLLARTLVQGGPDDLYPDFAIALPAWTGLLQSPPGTEVPAGTPSRMKPTDRVPVGFIRLLLLARTLVQGGPDDLYPDFAIALPAWTGLLQSPPG